MEGVIVVGFFGTLNFVEGELKGSQSLAENTEEGMVSVVVVVIFTIMVSKSRSG